MESVLSGSEKEDDAGDSLLLALVAHKEARRKRKSRERGSARTMAARMLPRATLSFASKKKCIVHIFFSLKFVRHE